MTGTRAPFRVRWIILGLLLVHLGWILALPPFRGVDEFDHAYRASAVAHGQWMAEPTAATRGTGAVVHVPPDIVDAAQPECQRLEYTGDPECVGTKADGHVEIASGAGRYHPLFYAIVGSPTLVFDGVVALYWMRVVALLMCLLLLAAAFAAARAWGHPTVAITMLCGITPMVLYSMSILAPNGLEMVAGVALWVALGAISRSDSSPATRSVVLALVSTCILVTLRSMGPLWALLIVGTALIAWPNLLGRLRSIIRTRIGVASLSVALAASVGSITWIWAQDSLVIGRIGPVDPIPLAEKLGIALQRVPQWILQGIGAFPLRGHAAPPIVYVVFLLVLGFVLVASMRAGSRRVRIGMLLVLCGSLAVPIGVTVATFEQYGTSWQGRYALPFLLGLSVLVGAPLALCLRSRGRRVFAAAVIPLVAIGHACSVVGVLVRERRYSPQSGEAAWILAPPTWSVAVLVVVGVAIAFVPLSKSWIGGSDEPVSGTG